MTNDVIDLGRFRPFKEPDVIKAFVEQNPEWHPHPVLPLAVQYGESGRALLYAARTMDGSIKAFAAWGVRYNGLKGIS